MNPLLFWVLAAASIVTGVLVALKRNPLGSALALAANMVALAGLFASLSAPFLFIIQILVYAGAVVVLIVFVIMLLNLREEELRHQAIQRGKFLAYAAACLLAVAVLLRAVGISANPPPPVESGFGSVEAMAGQIFTRFLLPFEVVSIILLVGIVGAVVIAKKGES